MDVPSVSPTRSLVGRDDALAVIGTPGASGGCVLICGEAGIGKTALLEHVAATAVGRVIWARGVETEATLPFAAVAELLLPLRKHFAGLPTAQRDALEVALALRSGAPTTSLAVCLAALGVLAGAGEDESLLVLVDDLHWVDAASRQVLLFVARRLSAERVVLLLAMRDGPQGIDVASDVPTVRLAGLAAQECRALLAVRGAEVSDSVLVKLVSLTGGNPLALIETVGAVTPAVLTGSGAGLTQPHVGPVLHRAWAKVIDELPGSTRSALVVLAASLSAQVRDVEPVLAVLGGSLVDLAPAERLGLVATRGREVGCDTHYCVR
jgi:hypothetical protein